MENDKPNSWRRILIYFNAALLLALIGGGTYYVVRIYTRGQTCFTVDQVQQSDKCLYIYKTSVYEKGTKAEPHRGNPCGSDVTSIIPDSHLLDKVGHLDPNYQGEICTNTAVPTATPTIAPTDTPQPTDTPAPPTNTPVPTQATQATNSNPTTTPTPLKTLPVTGKIEWIAAAVVPFGLVILGILF